jgi:tetratricopeptide (TPR) repeat protein
MTPALSALVPLLIVWLSQAPLAQAPTPPPSDEDAVRAAVQQYYDAQASRDPDRTLAFWSATANPRPGREAYLAVFGEPAEDTFVVDVRAVEITGTQARVRVAASRTRLMMRNAQPVTQRTTFLNSQLWRKESSGWKLLRDGPFAEEIADDLLAAPAADRAAMYQRYNRPDLVQTRLAVSMRATMAITIQKNYARGKALFELALEVARAAGDRTGEANSLHNIAQADYFLHDLAGAVEAYTGELAIARESDDRSAAAAAQFGLGTVAYSKAEYSPALGFYRDALTNYEKTDDGPSIARTVVSIGNVQYLQAEYDAAAASYRRGLGVALQFGDLAGATYARRGLGRVLAAQGDVAAALDMYNQVLADARSALQADARLTPDVASALEGIGELYFRVNNADRARAAFEEARKLYDADAEGAGRVMSMLGVTELVAGRFDAALAAYTESRAKFEAAKHGDGVAHGWVGIGFSQTARRKYAEAIAAYRTAIDLFTTLNNEDGVARASLGLSRAQSGDGNDTGALESAARVTAIADRIKSDDLLWRGAERAGEALRKLGKLDEARQAFTRAIDAIGRLAADAPVNVEARGNLTDSASAWAGLALTLTAQGDAAGALAATEARRAHLRRVALAAFQHDVAPGVTPDELTDEQNIVRDIIATRAQLRAEAQSAKRDQTRVERLGQQLTELAARRADQQARLYARLPELSLWRGLPQPAMDAPEIADLVPGAAGLLVTYVITDEDLLVVTAARGDNGLDVTARSAPIDRRAFADALAAAMQPDVLHNADTWRTRAAPLTAALLTPIAARLAGRDRIVIIADDLLWKVPFEALPLNDGDLASAASVTYATSLAALAVEMRQGALPAQPSAVFVAAPAIGDAVREQLQMVVPGWQEPDAAAALAAAQAGAKPYGETPALRSGADANEAAVRDALGASDVLHLQAPLLVSGTTPLLSSIILARDPAAAAPGDDGRFEAREWFARPGRARVLVLPDGSAFGAAGVGNAMDAIAWAAGAAGISTLIVGRWPTEGFDADAITAAFHAKLAAGTPVAKAWHDTVAAARERASAPAAWAGVRFIGGGRAPDAGAR